MIVDSLSLSQWSAKWREGSGDDEKGLLSTWIDNYEEVCGICYASVVTSA